ncbi:unnamed protein product [Darwinula stevensoni]|uniref:Nuclear protein localization protein 4 homolog n=1 Tax=Darwinula stevensoni TaxID=69355 RepID=A0A7R8XE96_9CRUS|nr:unnamed protein product [Darwinula stevensoni]CAG0887577.1 unnamed protein product [Darwinula stevensoni]
MANEEIILRVQSPDGTQRITISPSATTKELYEKVHASFNMPSFMFSLYKNKKRTGEIYSSNSQKIHSCNLKHGDMIFVNPVNGKKKDLSSSHRRSPSTVNVVEDEVDRLLWEQDGKIQRDRDPTYCRHSTHAQCVHCSPIDPWDENYLHDLKIKHLSFHAFLKKRSSGTKGTSVRLEDLNCAVKPGCKDHLPYPKGLCSKCMPSTITLSRQAYRHVDNVSFENPFLVERFLNYWRLTGHQRVGFLYGRYEIFKDVPLGIKATVAAIYEPPQESTRDTIQMLPDPKEELVKEIGKQLGLQCVGWIFTDLVAEDKTKGTVKYIRNIHDHFLSAQECITAAHLQNHNPNPCRDSLTGFYGSKFVTICVTGDSSNQVHMEGYQVSNQCMALVRDDCLVPTKDAPELAYIRESSNHQYVPDVYYREKDSYGNEVTKPARPLPIEYVLLDVPCSTPLEPQFTFPINPSITPFPVENRLLDGYIQDFSAFAHFMSQFPKEKFVDALVDFHVLIFIATMDTLPMKDHMALLLEGIRKGDIGQVQEWAQSDQWQTVIQLIQASGGSPPPLGVGGQVESGQGPGGSLRSPGPGLSSDSPGAQSSGPLWTCTHCTFLNQPHLDHCDVCGLPKG